MWKGVPLHVGERHGSTDKEVRRPGAGLAKPIIGILHLARNGLFGASTHYFWARHARVEMVGFGVCYKIFVQSFIRLTSVPENKHLV
jgi:hypothetical protein